MLGELKKKMEEKKAEVYEGWKRIERLEERIPEPLPKPENSRKLEDRGRISPLKKMMAKMGFKRDKDSGEGGDWTRLKSNID